MTKAAFITDTHIGLGFKDKRIHRALNVFADTMEGLKPDMIFHLGDTFHTKRPAADSIEFATSWFNRLANAADNVIVLAGGHDTDARMGVTAIDFLDDLATNITIVTEPVSLGNILLMPYIRRLTKENFDMMHEHSMVFMHQGIVEAPMDNQGRKYGSLGDAVPFEHLQHLDLCLNGHLHTPWSSGPIHVIGSPYPTRKGMYAEERSYPVLTLEDPSDIAFYNYENTFVLKNVDIEYDGEANLDLQTTLTKLLPPKDADTFYSVTVSVTGPVSQKLHLDIRKVVEMTYKGYLDDLSVISVLPYDQREVIEVLKRSARSVDTASPGAMLESWMGDKRRKAYFEANPKLRYRMVIALNDIISSISGSLDGSMD